MAYYRCGPTAIGNRASWSVTSPVHQESKSFDRPLSGNYDRIFNAFERTNAFEYVRSTFEGKPEERQIGHGDIVVNRKMSSSFERADCALAAQTPCEDDEDFYREKILYSQARQLFPLQEDLADWINKTNGITYLSGENFLDVLDNGADLCQLAVIIHERAREALDQGIIVGPVPAIRGRCWQRAARRSFFSRDNAENFITFCRELGVHENLLFESDDLVLHNQPRQVILCLLEVARLATKFNVEPPGLVQLEKEIALEERDSGLDSAMSGAAWQFRDNSPSPTREKSKSEALPSSPDDLNEDQQLVPDNVDAESTKSGGTESSTDTDVPLKPTNELDKRVQLVTRLMERGCNCSSGKCSKLLKVKKVGEGRYNIAGRNVFIRLLKGRHMMVRVGGGWDTLEHFLSRHEPCQVRLVTQGRRDVLPVTLPPTSPRTSPSPASSKGSLTKEPSLTGKTSPSPASSKSSLKESIPGTISPIGSKTSSISGKTSPDPRLNSKSRKTSLSNGRVSPLDSKASSISGKTSPIDSGVKLRKTSGKTSPLRTSTPTKPALSKNRSALTLPLKETNDKPITRRKQSAPSSFSTPGTPTGRSTRTPPVELRKSLTSNALLNAPKKSRSMSLANTLERKPICGTDRLNQNAKKNKSAVTTPTEPIARKTRSQSLASTPVNEPKKSLTNGYGKKTRSMSLAAPIEFGKPLHKSASVTTTGLTQAAIEDSIRRSLEASIADHTSPKKPFLHIKAKYRSPPPREVPPR
ncbi:GAS2-like protein 3 [Maniola hyperantus]|uniref:GAS2-like protein 3 n=1 Tax=Aphantopus hyperantus TaxID=2795564 RepID=UPI0015690C8F|nr:GAS2-like protein 3 [Maniola hyperantus]XP_034836630.1 GAS2-like protein 3 [Maniola hyperantus]XP_034836632.1 GAS2-like protein 3 [Maniola hyperantus]